MATPTETASWCCWMKKVGTWREGCPLMRAGVMGLGTSTQSQYKRFRFLGNTSNIWRNTQRTIIHHRFLCLFNTQANRTEPGEVRITETLPRPVVRLVQLEQNSTCIHKLFYSYFLLAYEKLLLQSDQLNMLLYYSKKKILCYLFVLVHDYIPRKTV